LPLMSKIFPFSTEIDVRGYEIDSFGHVNNAVYLNWLEHARWELGLTHALDLTNKETLSVVRHVTLDYRAQTLLGDRVRISIWGRHVGNTSFSYGNAIRIISSRQDPSRAGTVVATSNMIFACIDRKGQKAAVPEKWRAFFPSKDPGETLPEGV
jgi:YbgC/YbaW family acyl-CoA thioester hydrolase